MRGKVTPRAKRRAEPEPCADSLLGLASPAEEFTESVITSTETHSTTIRSTSSCSAADVTCSPTGASQSSSNLPSATNPKPWLSAGVKPYYLDERAGIAIFLGDCREILLTLGKFDLLLTDIPYGEVNRDSSGLRNLDKGSADTATVTPEWVAASAAPLCTSAYVWCGTEQVSGLRREFVSAGKTTRLGIWEKTNPSPMNGEHMWLSSIECCVFARSSGAVFNERCCGPVWRCPSIPETPHPTGKPTKLFRRLIAASSKPGDLVVDLCMGAGTTLRAAKDLNRRAIGIELEERWCEYSARRLSQEVLFA